MDINKKFEQLEKKIAQLETQNQVIINENNKLKAALAQNPKSTHSNADRSLAPLIDERIYKYLFDYDVDPKTGEIIKGVPSDRINQNFTNTYRYILQTLKPVGKITNGQKDKFYLKSPNFYELTEYEWLIFTKLMHIILNNMAMAKSIIDSEYNHTEEEIKSLLEQATFYPDHVIVDICGI